MPLGRTSANESPRGSKRHHIYEQIKELIRSDELGDGPITESTIAQRLHVSRTPVREALLQLRVEGWLQDGDDGLHVRMLDDAASEETYAIREALEGAAARLAATRSTPAELLALRSLAHEFTEAARQDEPVTKLDALNSRFHTLLHRSSHSVLLERMLEPLHMAVGRFTRSTFEDADRAEASAREHEALVEALQTRNPDEADRLARSHVRAGGQARAQLVAEELIARQDW